MIAKLRARRERRQLEASLHDACHQLFDELMLADGAPRTIRGAGWRMEPRPHLAVYPVRGKQPPMTLPQKFAGFPVEIEWVEQTRWEVLAERYKPVPFEVIRQRFSQ